MPKELVENVAKAANWKSVFFNAHQHKTLMVLTELIIPRTDTPGANDAKVHRYLDLFMSVGNFADRKQFLDGLTWLDNRSKQLYKRTFVQCSEEQQISLLRRMADVEKKENADIGHSFFNQAKNMTSLIYFSTPEGYKELNMFGPPPSTVGCEHPEGHATA
jgi:gluconate 2-dehydrogenase gamma chain